MMNQIQKMIDENPYVSGQAKPTNVIESSNYVLYASAEGIRHILDRHADEYAPGSLFVSGIDIVSQLEKIISTPGEGPDSRGMVKWLENFYLYLVWRFLQPNHPQLRKPHIVLDFVQSNQTIFQANHHHS